MSIPIMLASGLLGVKGLLEVEDLAAFLPVMLVGFITAGIIGYLSIRWLLSILRSNRSRCSLITVSIAIILYY